MAYFRLLKSPKKQNVEHIKHFCTVKVGHSGAVCHNM